MDLASIHSPTLLKGCHGPVTLVIPSRHSKEERKMSSTELSWAKTPTSSQRRFMVNKGCQAGSEGMPVSFFTNE